MNRTWQIIVAIVVLLACTAFGAVGGCTAGFIGALSVAEGGRGGSPPSNAGEQAGILFFVLLAAGGLVGLALGVFVARQILKTPPR